AQVGETLTAGAGTWTGVPTPSYSYQWKRDGNSIVGATNSTYQLVPGDYGTVITVTVTATNSEGSSSETSAGTSAVAGIAPVNTAAPVISGTPKVGETLSVTTGTWTGVPALSISYQWTRDESDISGATGSTYTLIEDDEDAMIGCRVTATNAEGSDSADAEEVGPVEAAGSARRYPTLIATPTSQPAVISQPQPALGVPVQFGDLETVVMRLTDVTRYHHYSTWQAFSADQSKLLLNGSGGHIYDTSDWSVIRSRDPGYVMCFFDPVDPDIIW